MSNNSGEGTLDFATQFHNLQGDLIGERKKNFFKLLHDASTTLNVQQLSDTLKNLQPNNYMENLFWVDSLIHFKQTPKLVELLKAGNEVFISKILKKASFIEDAFKNVDAEKFVNEFLPFVSFAIRMKLLKKVLKIWSETQIDALYDSLNERYGLFVAKTIIHSCSSTKFQKVLKENEIRLRPNQVKHLFDKDISSFIAYLDHIKFFDSEPYGETKVLHYVALKNPSLLLKLEKQEKVTCQRLGRRTSKKIMKLVKDDVRKDVKRYVNILNNNVIVRNLGSDFKLVYRQSFPKQIKNITMYDTNNKLLLLYPKNNRWNLFIDTYFTVFPNNKIEDVLVELNASFLKLNPTREIITKWADVNYNLDKTQNEDFLKYLEPSTAIAIIKEKINVTSNIKKRTALVMLLLDTCIQNRDLAALENVLKYICSRHRNEDASFRETLIRKLTNSPLKLEEFNENHWKYIDEQLKIQRLRQEFSFWRSKKLLKKRLEFLFVNNKVHEAAVIENINDIVDASTTFSPFLDNPDVEQQILTEICRLFPVVVTRDKNNFKSLVKELLISVIDFSAKHPEHCLKLNNFPELVSFIESCFSKTNKFDYDEAEVIEEIVFYNLTFPQNGVRIDNAQILRVVELLGNELGGINCFFKRVIPERLLRKGRSQFENDLLNLIFKCFLGDLFSRHHNEMDWFLRNDPRSLAPHFDRILAGGKATRIFDYKQLRCFSHFKFDEKVVNFYKKLLEKDDYDEKGLVMQGLIVLLQTDEFLPLVDRFLPQTVKVDMEDEEMRKVYKTQCEVAKILHKVQEPHKMLATLMKFCIGDYLQSTLPSLYGVFYRSPEKLLHPYMELLANGAVSVRKHAVFLSCELLDLKHVLALLKSTKEGNVSNKKNLFSATLKYFMKNPSRELFEEVIASMSTIDKNDEETLDSLIKSIKMPRKYQAMYIEKCWGFFEGLKESGGVQINSYLNSLLKQMSSLNNVKSLSRDFVRRLITGYFNDNATKLTELDSFVFKVLQHRVSESRENFDLVFDILPKLSRSHLNDFLNILIDVPEEDTQNVDREFIDTFSKYWNKHFTLLNAFEEHVALRLFQIRVDHRQCSEEYARNVVTYLDELTTQFGFHVFNIFKDKLASATAYMKETFKYSFFLEVLKYKCNPSTCILIIELMMERLDEESEAFGVYQSLMDTLKIVNEPIVKIYYKSYLEKY